MTPIQSNGVPAVVEKKDQVLCSMEYRCLFFESLYKKTSSVCIAKGKSSRFPIYIRNQDVADVFSHMGFASSGTYKLQRTFYISNPNNGAACNLHSLLILKQNWTSFPYPNWSQIEDKEQFLMTAKQTKVDHRDVSS